MAARCSAINSRSAALDLEERSGGETQESVLDDRRERAHPVGDEKNGNLPPTYNNNTNFLPNF
jgi:hypothetical protein